MNTTTPRRQRIVFYVLIAVSILLFVGLEFGLDGTHPGKNVSAVVAIVAFIKARYVILDFMELRGTRVMRIFDLWLMTACAVCVFLILY